jgi:hypothetical protein
MANIRPDVARQELKELVKKSIGPYRRSIWENDLRYRIDFESLSRADLDLVASLSWINAAKINVPPITPEHLLRISKGIEAMQIGVADTADRLEQFLIALREDAGASSGSGIRILICMLAVKSNGLYSPIDRKIAAGLRSLGIVTPREERILNGTNPRTFSGTYYAKVLPAWRKALVGRGPQDVDEEWGEIGSKLLIKRRQTARRRTLRRSIRS